jgi:crotonobetainyl-CoA:carnitine CoA-transferase CaiB-like acyl-CoA transferase
LAALEAAKVPCGAINNLAEVFADSTSSPATWWTHGSTRSRTICVCGQPTQTQRDARARDLPPPLLGQHPGRTAEVLDYSDPEIVELQRQKVI